MSGPYPSVPDAHCAVLTAGPQHDRLVVIVAVVFALDHQQARDTHSPVLLELENAKRSSRYIG
jgi:hypothetical protein